LRHHPADGRILLQQMDIITGVGQVQGGLDAGAAAPTITLRNIFA
jgi:hypothetical protein